MWYTKDILIKGAWRTVFGISMGELVLIMVVALIVLGPKQLLETAKVAGKVYRELVKMAGEIRNSVDLDALTSDHEHHVPPSPPPPPPVKPSPANADEETMPPLGEKSGPDFYADLLESAREQVRETEAAAEDAKESGVSEANKPDVPETTEPKEKDHQPAEIAKTT